MNRIPFHVFHRSATIIQASDRTLEPRRTDTEHSCQPLGEVAPSCQPLTSDAPMRSVAHCTLDTGPIGGASPSTTEHLLVTFGWSSRSQA